MEDLQQAFQALKSGDEMPSRYEYALPVTPPSIRLFEILPAAFDEPIHGKIHCISLGDLPVQPSGSGDQSFRDDQHGVRYSSIFCNPPPKAKLDIDYDALSYRWGDENIQTQIICDGRYLPICGNLLNALRRLRPLPGEVSRFIWADQICINQGDLKERANQVPFMGAIFYFARRVVAYLGESTASLPTAINLAEQLATSNYRATSQLEFDGVNYWKSSKTTETGTEDTSSLPQYISSYDDEDLTPEDEAWESLRAFFACEWFGRIWILQEYLLASGDLDFICGGTKIDLGIFMEAIQAANQHGITSAFTCRKSDKVTQEAVTRGIECLGLMRQYGDMYAMGVRLGLSRLLPETRHMGATNPRDRMFALANLISDGDHQDLRPDYSASIAEISRRFARYVLEHDQTSAGVSSILYQCDWDESIPESNKVGAPSWVPDWHRPLTGAHVAWQIKSSLAGGKGPVKLHFANDKNLLELRGRYLGSIVETGHGMREQMAESASPAYSEYGTLLEAAVLAARLSKYPNGDSIWEAFWRTLIANKTLPLPGDKSALLEGYNQSAFFDPQPASPSMQYLAIYYIDSLLHVKDERDHVNLDLLARSLRKMALDSQSNHFLTYDDRIALMGLSMCSTKQNGMPDTDPNILQAARRFREGCLLTSRSKRTLCLLQKQFRDEPDIMGIVPSDARKGDRVCVFDGVHTPWVVRRKGNHDLLIGACYIHGLMGGQAYWHDEYFPPEDISLC